MNFGRGLGKHFTMNKENFKTIIIQIADGNKLKIEIQDAMTLAELSFALFGFQLHIIKTANLIEIKPNEKSTNKESN